LQPTKGLVLTTIELNAHSLPPGLYLIAMPIGNPKDIGLRSMEYLLSADVIACEDTREFQNTMSQITKHKWNLISHHKNNESQSAAGILQLIQSGKSVCLVSDAGTINISDPGSKVLRLLLENKIFITSLPGPSALSTALSMYPVQAPVTFYGFIPNTENEKKKLFESLLLKEESLAFYESPHRLIDTLILAEKIFGERKLFIAREISKTYEEYLYVTIREAIDTFTSKAPKGEFVLIFAPAVAATVDPSLALNRIRELLKKQHSSKDILEIIKTEFKLKRNEIYQYIEDIKEELQRG
jgi:16S rRNA (cytidine1402-2'-O)-methyltransferase